MQPTTHSGDEPFDDAPLNIITDGFNDVLDVRKSLGCFPTVLVKRITDDDNNFYALAGMPILSQRAVGAR